MPYFRLGEPGTPMAEAYWVEAGNEQDARTSIARLVPGLEFADDPKLYECFPDTTHTPEPGIVVDGRGRRYGGRR